MAIVGLQVSGEPRQTRVQAMPTDPAGEWSAKMPTSSVLLRRSDRAPREASSDRRSGGSSRAWSNGGRELNNTPADKEVDDWFRN